YLRIPRRVPDREWLWIVSGDDEGPLRDRPRRQQRRNGLVAVRIQMETRRRETGTGLVRAAPAKTRLADVVCGFGNAAGKSVDWRPSLQTVAGLPRCRPIA